MKCEYCQGNGATVHALGEETCKRCNGSGYISASPTQGADARPVATDAVLAAVERMCQPLHESRLSGVTAQEDARCMKLIRDFVYATRDAAPSDAQLMAGVEERRKMAVHRSFNTMCWPTPCADLSDAAWRLTHDFSDKTDRLVAASVIDAYAHLIASPAKRRNEIIAELKKGPNTGAATAPMERT